MATAIALVDKVKFQNTGKYQYHVETILGGTKCRWKKTCSTYEEALAYIENERATHNPSIFPDKQFLITEVFTRTMGLI